MNLKMKYKRHIILVMLLFCSLYSNAASHRMKFGDDIVIRVLPVLPGMSTHGYAEYSFTVQNRSFDKAHTVGIKIPKYTSFDRFSDSVQISKRVTVSPGTTATMKVYQPSINISNSQALVTVDGLPQKNELVIDRVYFNDYKGPCVLHSKQVQSSLINEFETQLKSLKKSHRTSSNEFEFARSELPLEQWPTNELAYSRYDAIVITNDDLTKLPQKVKDGLVRYTELGGNLIVTNGAFVPQSWQKYCSDKSVVKVGFGKIFNLALPTMGKTLDAEALKNRFSNLNLEPIIGSIMDLQNKFSMNSFSDDIYNKEFPVVDNLSIPVRPLFFMMLAFSLIIGPLNIIYLIKKKKRIMLLVTVPVISIIFTIIISVVALISEGIQGTSRTSTYTILDQTTNRAITQGITAYYFPIAPWNGLRFNLNTELNLCKSDNGNNARNYEEDQTNGQLLESGWISSRVPTHFIIRKSEIRRERINFSKCDNGDIIALNGFPCDIKTLYFADNTGVLYKIENIQAGQKKVLSKLEGGYKVAGDLTSFNSIYKNGMLKEKKIDDSIAETLVPNSYFAFMNATPFVEKVFEDCKEVKHRSLVYGFIKEVK